MISNKKKAVRSKSIQKEIFRTLRSNIEFTGIENRVIMITSCRPGDGKSTVTYQLAAAFAESEKECIIVDADMRKSMLVKRIGITDVSAGLSDYLSGQKGTEDCIYKTELDHLSIIPSGVFPPNPTELLSHERFAVLLDDLKQRFDYIFLDTPPLGNVIDAAVIARNCNGSILIVPSDHYSRAEVCAVKEQLYAANPNILGVVLNRFDTKKNGYGQNQYYGKYYSKYYV